MSKWLNYYLKTKPLAEVQQTNQPKSTHHMPSHFSPRRWSRHWPCCAPPIHQSVVAIF